MADRKTSAGLVGAHTVDITPDFKFAWNERQLRRNLKDESGLLAHVVVFSDGNDIGAVVACDLPMIGRPYALAYRELASFRSGIPGKNIQIAANHDHTAPWISPGFLINGCSPDPIYAEFVGDRTSTAVAEARKKMKPAVFASGKASGAGVSFNRRYLKPGGGVAMVFSTERDGKWPAAGPADDELGWILFEEPNGTPVALITSFSAHNHVVGGSPVPGRPPHEFWHRDFGGRFGDVVRRELGAPIPTAYLAGASGNTAWQDPQVPPPVDGPAAAWDIGGRLAAIFLGNYRGAPRRPITDLRFSAHLAEIPDRPLADSMFCDDACRGLEPELRDFDRRRYGTEREALKARGDGTSSIAEMTATAFGDVAISTNPAELFVEFGLEIKKRSPFGVTLVSELTNGYVGYVPTEESFPQGGYETHRSMFTSRLAKNAGRIITEASVKALENLAR